MQSGITDSTSPGNGVYFNGAIGEAHVVGAALSSSWIATEYSNENNPAAFYNSI